MVVGEKSEGRRYYAGMAVGICIRGFIQDFGVDTYFEFR
jgi:hypothetical protein